MACGKFWPPKSGKSRDLFYLFLLYDHGWFLGPSKPHVFPLDGGDSSHLAGLHGRPESSSGRWMMGFVEKHCACGCHSIVRA
jgi:hypothetical protein